jgi:hypothetical protein
MACCASSRAGAGIDGDPPGTMMRNWHAAFAGSQLPDLVAGLAEQARELSAEERSRLVELLLDPFTTAQDVFAEARRIAP